MKRIGRFLQRTGWHLENADPVTSRLVMLGWLFGMAAGMLLAAALIYGVGGK